MTTRSLVRVANAWWRQRVRILIWALYTLVIIWAVASLHAGLSKLDMIRELGRINAAAVDLLLLAGELAPDNAARVERQWAAVMQRLDRHVASLKQSAPVVSETLVRQLPRVHDAMDATQQPGIERLHRRLHLEQETRRLSSQASGIAEDNLQELARQTRRTAAILIAIMMVSLLVHAVVTAQTRRRLHQSLDTLRKSLDHVGTDKQDLTEAGPVIDELRPVVVGIERLKGMLQRADVENDRLRVQQESQVATGQRAISLAQTLRTSRSNTGSAERTFDPDALLLGSAQRIREPLDRLQLLLAQLGMAEITKQRFKMVSEAEDEICSITAVLDDLQLFARREDSAEPAACELDHVVNQVIEDRREMLIRQKIRLDLDIAPGLKPLAIAHESLYRILSGLIENAVRAVADNADREIKLAAMGFDERVCVVVSDNGQGVPAALHQRIFEPFFNADSTPASGGLSLSLARRLLLDTGGDIVLVPGEGPGATFRMQVPVATLPPADPLPKPPVSSAG